MNNPTQQLLTHEEKWECYERSHGNTEYTKAMAYARAIESKVLEKLNCLEPVAWRAFDGEGGYDYCGYTGNEDYRDEFIKRNPSPTYKNWVEPLYALEKNA